MTSPLRSSFVKLCARSCACASFRACALSLIGEPVNRMPGARAMMGPYFVCAVDWEAGGHRRENCEPGYRKGFNFCAGSQHRWLWLCGTKETWVVRYVADVPWHMHRSTHESCTGSAGSSERARSPGKRFRLPRACISKSTAADELAERHSHWPTGNDHWSSAGKCISARLGIVGRPIIGTGRTTSHSLHINIREYRPILL